MRRPVRRLVGAVRRTAALRVLPAPVARFHFRAHRLAEQTHDVFSLRSAARPYELHQLLDLAEGQATVVELGTGTAWTAIALALADPSRRVVSYDPVVRAERSRYLELVAPGVRARIDLRAAPGEQATPTPGSVDFVFLDSDHHFEPTLATARAWLHAVRPGGVLAFHDFDHPDWPGVRQAVEALELQGDVVGGLFVWRAPEASS